MAFSVNVARFFMLIPKEQIFLYIILIPAKMYCASMDHLLCNVTSASQGCLFH